jgi:biopolymer transport protein ExbB/TolQ
MGTLIPLAPGLSALGDGDYKQLAGDLKTAFAATVVGILVGTGAYVLTLLRTRNYTEDLASLERAVAARQVHPQPHQRMETTIGGDAL